MGGILSDMKRDSLMAKLRKAARDALRDQSSRSLAMRGKLGVIPVVTSSMRLLDYLWRQFPECSTDDSVPSPEEILAICERYDADKLEQLKLVEWFGKRKSS